MRLTTRRWMIVVAVWAVVLAVLVIPIIESHRHTNHAAYDAQHAWRSYRNARSFEREAAEDRRASRNAAGRAAHPNDLEDQARDWSEARKWIEHARKREALARDDMKAVQYWLARMIERNRPIEWRWLERQLAENPSDDAWFQEQITRIRARNESTNTESNP